MLVQKQGRSDGHEHGLQELVGPQAADVAAGQGPVPEYVSEAGRPPAQEEQAGVAFAPGQVFFPGEATENGLRLSFSATSVEAINQGIPVLGELLAAYLARPPQLPAPGSNP